MSKKNWWKFFWWSVGALLGSFVLACVFWKWFGNSWQISSGHMDIDFFNTICGCFTIVGLIVALYQIAKLTSQQEEIDKNTKAVISKISGFDHLININKCNNIIDGIRPTLYNNNIANVDQAIREVKGILISCKSIDQRFNDRITVILTELTTTQGILAKHLLNNKNNFDVGKLIEIFENISDLSSEISYFYKFEK